MCKLNKKLFINVEKRLCKPTFMFLSDNFVFNQDLDYNLEVKFLVEYYKLINSIFERLYVCKKYSLDDTYNMVQIFNGMFSEYINNNDAADLLHKVNLESSFLENFFINNICQSSKLYSLLIEVYNKSSDVYYNFSNLIDRICIFNDDCDEEYKKGLFVSVDNILCLCAFICYAFEKLFTLMVFGKIINSNLDENIYYDIIKLLNPNLLLDKRQHNDYSLLILSSLEYNTIVYDDILVYRYSNKKYLECMRDIFKILFFYKVIYDIITDEIQQNGGNFIILDDKNNRIHS